MKKVKLGILGVTFGVLSVISTAFVFTAQSKLGLNISCACMFICLIGLFAQITKEKQ